MTVIAAIRTYDRIIIAADQQATGDDKTYINKIIENGDYVLSSCGDAVLMTVLKHMDIPQRSKKDDAAQWISKRFLPALKKELNAYGTLKKESDRTYLPGSIMIAWRGELWVIEENGYAYSDDSVAIGSGAVIAKGVFKALEAVRWIDDSIIAYTNVAADDAVRIAVETAIAIDPYCGGCVDIVRIHGGK